MADASSVSLITVGVALSGWGKLAYDYLIAQPSVKGRVLNVMRGVITLPPAGPNPLASWLVYLYLTNRRKSPVYVLDYQLEIFARGHWRKMRRIYGTQNLVDPSFLDPSGGKIEIKNFSGNQINRKDAPVDYGKPLHGWLMFVGDREYYDAPISQYKVTCIDVFDRSHEIVTSKEEFADLALLQDIAGISFSPVRRQSL